MKRKLKPWDELSPSGKRYRKKTWEKAHFAGPDVFWDGDLDIRDLDIHVPGNLTVTGNISVRNITVDGDFVVKGSIELIDDEVSGYLKDPTHINCNGSINVGGNMIIPNCCVASINLHVKGNLSAYTVIISTVDVDGSIDVKEMYSKSVIVGINITADKLIASDDIEAHDIFVSSHLASNYIDCVNLNIGGDLYVMDIEAQNISVTGGIILKTENQKVFEIRGSGNVYICTPTGSEFKVFFKKEARA